MEIGVQEIYGNFFGIIFFHSCDPQRSDERNKFMV